MTAPDFREWVELPTSGEFASADLTREPVESMRARGATFGRFVIVDGADRGRWLCIDGWKERPDDQGPEPTAADIPVGFV